MNVKESNLLTNHPSQIDKHVLESFLQMFIQLLIRRGYLRYRHAGDLKYILSK